MEVAAFSDRAHGRDREHHRHGVKPSDELPGSLETAGRLEPLRRDSSADRQLRRSSTCPSRSSRSRRSRYMPNRADAPPLPASLPVRPASSSALGSPRWVTITPSPRATESRIGLVSVLDCLAGTFHGRLPSLGHVRGHTRARRRGCRWRAGGNSGEGTDRDPRRATTRAATRRTHPGGSRQNRRSCTTYPLPARSSPMSALNRSIRCRA